MNNEKNEQEKDKNQQQKKVIDGFGVIASGYGLLNEMNAALQRNSLVIFPV